MTARRRPRPRRHAISVGRLVGACRICGREFEQTSESLRASLTEAARREGVELEIGWIREAGWLRETLAIVADALDGLCDGCGRDVRAGKVQP